LIKSHIAKKARYTDNKQRSSLSPETINILDSLRDCMKNTITSTVNWWIPVAAVMMMMMMMMMMC